MKGSSVKSGIIKVSVIGVSVMVFGLVFYYFMQIRHNRSIEQLSRNDRSMLATKILEIHSKQYSNIVRDNSAWDEFIESFTGEIDSLWLLNNIGYMLENYDATCVGVFDTLGNLVYQRKAANSEDISFFDFDGKNVTEIFSGKLFSDFYLKIDKKIYEYHGAGVVSAADMVTRTEKPKGYLIMVKKISYGVLSEYRDAIGNADVGLVFTEEGVKHTEKQVFPNYLITKSLNDYNNVPAGYIYFVFKNPLVKMFKNFLVIFLIVSVMCIFIVLAIVRYAHVKITRPLRNISESFKTGKTDKIQPLKAETNEFGVISGMMEEFFIQKDNLAKLNADLRQSREEILVQNEALHQQKEEILVQHENLSMLNEELSAINEDLEAQKVKLENANNQLTAGITYASRLQSSMLQAVEPSHDIFKNFCVVYYPKDIVGGDFYVTRKIGDTVIAALGDGTGHGVPGAMLASMGISFLTQLVHECPENDLLPDEILMRLKEKVSSALGLDKDGEQRSDGMDVALLIYNKKTRNGYFAGAQRPMVLIRDNEAFTIKGDNIPIGHFVKDGKFTAVNIQLQKGDKIYLFSDGCTDQTGGEKKRRLMLQNFREKLLEFSVLSFPEQKKAIEDLIFGWKGELPQTDDISLLAFEIE